ncbi:MAG: cyclodeaminase/cyclohydrolase family protein [Elusimicrobiota bacterium]
MAQDWEQAAQALVEAFASTEPTPGGGSAAGVVAAIGCSLGRMASGISMRSKKADETAKAVLGEAHAAFQRMGERFLQLTREDARAFDSVMEAYRLPKEDPSRGGKIQERLFSAAAVPLQTAEAAVQALLSAREMRPRTLGSVSSDMDCAAHLLEAAARCALTNVGINLSLMKDDGRAKALRERAEAVRRGLGA